MQVEGYDDDNKIIENLQTGTLNKTAISFIPELPIEIYPNASKLEDESQTETNDFVNNNRKRYFGPIFYNDLTSAYIRPNSNINVGDIIEFVNHPNSPKLIDNINRETYKITIDPNHTPIPFIDLKLNEIYKIKTCFIDSNENVFYVYTKPSLKWYLNDIFNQDTIFVNQRYCSLRVEYSQEQNISWKSYSFRLYDESGVEIQSKKETFDGEISFDLYGLITGKKYTVKLIIEDQYDRIITEERELNVSFEEREVSSSVIWKFDQDCDSASVKIEVQAASYVLSDNSDSAIKYLNDSAILENGYGLDGLVYKNYYTLPDQEYKSQEMQIGKEQKYTRFQSEHTITSENYKDEIIGMSFKQDGVIVLDYALTIIPEIYNISCDTQGLHELNMIYYNNAEYQVCDYVMVAKTTSSGVVYSFADTYYDGVKKTPTEAKIRQSSRFYNQYIVNDSVTTSNAWAPINCVYIKEEQMIIHDRDYMPIQGNWNSTTKLISFPLQKAYYQNASIWTDYPCEFRWVVESENNGSYNEIRKNILIKSLSEYLYYWENDTSFVWSSEIGGYCLLGSEEYWFDEINCFEQYNNQTGEIDPQVPSVNSYIVPQIKKEETPLPSADKLLNKTIQTNLLISTDSNVNVKTEINFVGGI